MRLPVEYPLLVRARPKKARSEKYVLCSVTRVADVAEVSRAETETVVECQTKRKLGRFRMLGYDGRLFRKVAESVEDALDGGLLNDPFASVVRRNHVGYKRRLADWGGVASGRSPEDMRPLAKPLATQFDWQLVRDSGATDLQKAAWPIRPETASARDALHAHRNGVRFSDIAGQIGSLNDEDLAEAEHMQDICSARVLVVEGELWVESPPLGFRVETEVEGHREPTTVRVSLCTVPDGYDGDLYTQHFGLADRDLAMAEADALMRKLAKQAERDADIGAAPPVLDVAVPAFHFTDDRLMYHDRARDAVRRFGYMAAVECNRAVARQAPYTDRLDADDLALIERAYRAARVSNYVTDVHSDMSGFCRDLDRVWKKINNPQHAADGFHGVRGIRMERARVFKSLDEMPISLDSGVFAP